MTSPPTILELNNNKGKYNPMDQSNDSNDNNDDFDDDYDYDGDYDGGKRATNLDRSSSPERPKAMYWPSFSRATNYRLSQLLSSGL